VGGGSKRIAAHFAFIAAAIRSLGFLTIVKHQLDRYNASEPGVPFAETLHISVVEKDLKQ